MRLNQILNLKNWHQRNLQVGYGTRSKTVLKKTKMGKVYYLAKTYDKDSGELRSEVCASSIGRLFGFPVQKTWLCRIPQFRALGLKHRIGVLIQLDVRRQRYTKRKQFREDLIHGAALISLINNSFGELKTEKERRKIYTLNLVVNAIRKYVSTHDNSQRLWEEFFELLILDALIGGTDRHYNNWGILEKADDGKFLRLSPAFDNGISLMWKMEEYRPKIIKDLWTSDFIRRAESMFKKSNGGKYDLFEVLEELYKIGDYRGTNLAGKMLTRINKIKVNKIDSSIFRNVPIRATFKTQKENLGTICIYVKMRLRVLKEVLNKISQKYDSPAL